MQYFGLGLVQLILNNDRADLGLHEEDRVDAKSTAQKATDPVLIDAARNEDASEDHVTHIGVALQGRNHLALHEADQVLEDAGGVAHQVLEKSPDEGNTNDEHQSIDQPAPEVLGQDATDGAEEDSLGHSEDHPGNRDGDGKL